MSDIKCFHCGCIEELHDDRTHAFIAAVNKPRQSYEEFMHQDEAKPKPEWVSCEWGERCVYGSTPHKHNKNYPWEVANSVSAPEHYTFGGIDTIDFIRAKVTTEMLEGFYFGNVMKYLVRYRHKDGLRDLQKAKVYLQWLIDLEGGSDK